jgi:hypothetical protein
MMSLDDSGSTELETIPLSRRQRRDLVELVAAGVMSAVFFALPVVMVRDTFTSRSVPPPAPEHSHAPRTVRAADPASVQVITTDVAVPISSPELQSAAPAVVRAVRWNTPPRTRRTVPAVVPRPSLGRRIARLFIGDGTHTVQPFPSVPATER